MRLSDMRNRVAALAAVSAFAVAVAGVAVVAARSGGSSLERLPTLAAGREGAAADMATLGAPSFGATEYVVEGTLADLPLEAAAYRLPDGVERQQVERLAEALGVQGPVVRRDRSYVVAAADRQVAVEDAPGAPWYLSAACPDAAVSSDGSVSSAGCASTAVAKACVAAPSEPSKGADARTGSAVCSVPPDAGGGSSGSAGSSGSTAEVKPCPPCPPNADCDCPGPAPTPVPLPPPRPPDLPDRAAAERIARDVFGRLGLPLDTLKLDGGEWSWQATVSPPVGGLPVVGLDHNLTIGPKGEVTNAHGYLRAARRIGDYPLVGVQQGLDRLRDGAGVGPMPLADSSGREPAIDLPAGKHVVTLTGVHLALQQVGEVLVPVYAFEVKGGGELTVPAVTDRYLERVRPPDGRPEPAPADTGSGACSGSGAGTTDGEANQPLTVGVCVEPAKAKVGQEVTFTVTVTDPDAEIYEGMCEGPSTRFGDEEMVASTLCGHACGAGGRAPHVTERKAGEVTRTFKHAYAKAGTYTATFFYRSDLCSKWSSAGEGTATVVVVE